MENKQTAVDWLEEQISLLHALTTIEISLFEQAKQMQEEQIEEAFNSSSYFIDGKEYYDNTYGK
jgi:hypothetical protein